MNEMYERYWQTIAFSMGLRPRAFLLMVSAVLLVIVLHIPEVTMLVETDWQVYALGGKVLNSGGRMYLDFFDHKGPFVFFIYAFGWWLWPDYMGTWIIESSIFICALWVFWTGVFRRFGNLSACFAVLSVLSIKLSVGDYGRPESFALELAILSLGLLLCRLSWARCCVVGAACAVTFFMKQTLICPYVGIFLFLALSQRGKRFLFLLGAFCVSFLLVFLGVMLYMYSTGVLNEYWRDCFVFNFISQNANPYFANGFCFESFARSISHTFIKICQYGGLAFAGLLAFAVRPIIVGKKWHLALFIGWTVAFLLDLSFVARCGRIYNYQCDFLRFWCVVAVLPLVGACELFFRSENLALVSRRNLFLILVFVPTLSFPFLREVNRLCQMMQTFFSKENDDSKIIAQINGLPPAPMFVWGNCGNLYLKTNRRCVSSCYYWAPFCVDGFLSENEIDSAVDVIVEKGAIIVEKPSCDAASGGWLNEDSAIVTTQRFKLRLRDALSRHYKLFAVCQGAKLYIPFSMVPKADYLVPACAGTALD